MAAKELGGAIFTTLSGLLRRKEMRPIVRVFTGLHTRLYRLTGGQAQVAKYPTMLLTTTGRKTGKPRTVPLVYVADGDRFVIAAAYSGSDSNPTWWLNLLHSREAVVEVPERRVHVQMKLAEPGERDTLWERLVAMYPNFEVYQKRTQREIPVAILTPAEPQQA